MARVVIVGGSVAGVTTAKVLRENGFQGEVVLLSDEDRPPYDRPPLTKGFLLAGEEEPWTFDLAPKDWYKLNEVELRLGSHVVEAEAQARAVTLADGQTLEFDHLVAATGCSARTLQVPGLGHLPTVGTLRDAGLLREALRAGRHLVIVGAGFIALEVAAAASSRGVPVTVLGSDRGSVMRVVDRGTAGWLVADHARRGVRFLWGESIFSGERRGVSATLMLSTGEVIADAFPIAAIGSSPNIGWLRGVEVSDGLGVRCDQWCRAEGTDVFAVGDVSYAHNLRVGRHVLNRHWANAVSQATVAAMGITGVRGQGLSTLPYFWSDQAELKIRYAGDLDTVDVLYRDDNERGRLVVYGREGHITGVVTINRPADFVRFQRQIGGVC